MQLIFVDSGAGRKKINLQHADCSFNLCINDKNEVTNDIGSLHLLPGYVAFARKEGAYQYLVETLSSQVMTFVSLFPDYFPKRVLLRKKTRHGVDEVIAFALLHPFSRQCVLDSHVKHRLIAECNLYYTNHASFVKYTRKCILNDVMNMLTLLQEELNIAADSESEVLTKYFELATIRLCHLLDRGLDEDYRIFQYELEKINGPQSINLGRSFTEVLKLCTEQYKFVKTELKTNFETLAERLFHENHALERVVIVKEYGRGRKGIRCFSTSEYYTESNEYGNIVIRRKQNLIDIGRLNKLEPIGGGWRTMPSGGIIKGPWSGTQISLDVLHENLKL